MSIQKLREAFHAAISPQGIRCTNARMSYCDADGGISNSSHQRLEFDVIDSKNNALRTITSDPIPGSDSLTVAAIKLAQKTFGV